MRLASCSSWLQASSMRLPSRPIDWVWQALMPSLKAVSCAFMPGTQACVACKHGNALRSMGSAAQWPALLGVDVHHARLHNQLSLPMLSAEAMYRRMGLSA